MGKEKRRTLAKCIYEIRLKAVNLPTSPLISIRLKPLIVWTHKHICSADAHIDEQNMHVHADKKLTQINQPTHISFRETLICWKLAQTQIDKLEHKFTRT